LATRTAPTLADIQAARGRIAGVARVTPIFTSETLSGLAGRELLLKCENFQRTGAVKVRGAVNKIATLSDAERRAGVVAATAGNHGQAVAWAAREAGIRATIFMPRDTPMAKVGATQRYGAVIELNATGLEEAFEAAQAYAAETGATFVHAYEDEVVIAGQGTIALELVDQLPGVETVVVPIGGGGLASGIAIALGELRPEVRIVGVQAAACAPFAGSKKHGFTIAEGIAVKRPGELTSAILRDRLEEVVTVTDEQISQAIVLLLERAKVVVEGAGAAPVARQHRLDPADRGHPARAHLRRPLPRRPHEDLRPSRRARQAARARRGGARERRLGRAPPRGDGDLHRRERGRADADHPRPGALHGAARPHARVGLPRRAGQVAVPSSVVAVGHPVDRSFQTVAPRSRTT
jgi:threonine dehydratase